MNVIGFSGFNDAAKYKRSRFPGLSERQYRIRQGLDSAAALVRDGRVVAATAEERFTFEKGTGSFPLHALKYCLESGALQPKDIDFIAHSFCYNDYRQYYLADDYLKGWYEQVYAPQIQVAHLRKFFSDVDWGKKFVPVPHHLSHAAGAYLLSGLDEALVVIADGMGEADSLSVLLATPQKLQLLERRPVGDSLGILYGIVTLYLGYWMNHDEYKVMGLAPYGRRDRYYKQFMDFFALKDNGVVTIPLLRSDKTEEEKETHSGVLRVLAKTFGATRQEAEPIEQHHADVAAGMQSALETAFLHILRHFQKQTGAANLCMGGGVALNCSLNGAIYRRRFFRKMFVQPAAGDDGAAVGAALYVQRIKDPTIRYTRLMSPLWGPLENKADIPCVLEARTDFTYTRYQGFKPLCLEAAKLLAAGRVIGWCRGQMEFGPRALGARSIFADPRDPQMRDRLNRIVKERESYRPFAPCVRAEDAAAYFDLDSEDAPIFEHMTTIAYVRPEHRASLPATTHVDGTARVQTVFKTALPETWSLLADFGQLTGMPVLLNTSLNRRGQPIIGLVEHAIEMLSADKLDALVVGDYLVQVKR